MTKKKKAKALALKELEASEKLPKSIQLTLTERDELGKKVVALRSDQMRKYILTWMQSGGQVEEAYKTAYPDADPARMSEKINILMRRPDIKDIVNMVQREIIPSRIKLGGLIGFKVLEDIAGDDKMSPKARVQAAKTLVEQGYGTPEKRYRIERVSWHGSLPKEFLAKKIKEHQAKNLEARGEAEIEIIDIEE